MSQPTLRHCRNEPLLKTSTLLALAALAAAAVIAGLLLITLRQEENRSENDPRWGPVAAVDVSGSNMELEAILAGTIRITDSCVFVVDAAGDQTFLVWPGDRTRWDPSMKAVLFADRAGGVAALRDGQLVSLGGGGSSAGEGGLGGLGWALGLDWMSRPPDGSCNTDSRWFVANASAE